MSYYSTYSLYEIIIYCFVFEFTINGWACNPHFFHDARDGNTTVFNSFLQDFALV